VDSTHVDYSDQPRQTSLAKKNEKRREKGREKEGKKLNHEAEITLKDPLHVLSERARDGQLGREGDAWTLQPIAFGPQQRRHPA
jgi:hypothetical protein